MIEILVEFYGAFRKFGLSQKMEVKNPSSIADIKKELLKLVHNPLLIEESVMANDLEILSEDHIIDKNCTLSILPPVCGG